VTTNYTYDNANRIASVNSQAYTYDANGNLTNDGQYTYSYDMANRLTQLVGNGVTTNYRYNGNGDRLQYSTSTGNFRNYNLDLNTSLPVILQDGYSTYTYGNGQRLGYELFEEYYQFENDSLGSVRQIIKNDRPGTVSWINSTTTYDPHGNVVLQAGWNNDHGYAGEFQDKDLNDLVYLRARYMSPRTGTFLSRDSWDGDANQPMSYNKWMYGNGNPIIYNDPSGYRSTSNQESCSYSDLGGNAAIVESNINLDKSQWINTYTAAGLATQCWGMTIDGRIGNDTWGPAQVSVDQSNTPYDKGGLQCYLPRPQPGEQAADNSCYCFSKEEKKGISNFDSTYILENPLEMRDWNNAATLMMRRIKHGLDQCQENNCTNTDKYLFAALAQNGPGFTPKEVLKNINQNDTVKKDWKEYFATRNGINTKEQLVRFTYAIDGLVNRKWVVPDNLDHSLITFLSHWDPSVQKFQGQSR
jgi:RHS repeat-associated protein